MNALSNRIKINNFSSSMRKRQVNIRINYFYLDGPIHGPYQHYGPEYYPGPAYPIYPDEDYFPSQIHVKKQLLIFFF
jgi:hypothetical protein